MYFGGRWVGKHTKAQMLHNIKEATQCKYSPHIICLCVGIKCPGMMQSRLPGYLSMEFNFPVSIDSELYFWYSVQSWEQRKLRTTKKTLFTIALLHSKNCLKLENFQGS